MTNLTTTGLTKLIFIPSPRGAKQTFDFQLKNQINHYQNNNQSIDNNYWCRRSHHNRQVYCPKYFILIASKFWSPQILGITMTVCVSILRFFASCSPYARHDHRRLEATRYLNDSGRKIRWSSIWIALSWIHPFCPKFWDRVGCSAFEVFRPAEFLSSIWFLPKVTGGESPGGHAAADGPRRQDGDPDLRRRRHPREDRAPLTSQD